MRKLIAFRGRDKRGDTAAEPGPDYHKTKSQLRGELPDDTTLPERAAFGLPYAQAYSSLPKHRPNSRKYPTATFTPEWHEGGRTIDGRRASPLFCKIVRLAEGQFFWQVVFLPSQFLPAGATVRGERTDVEPKVPLPTSSFASPTSLGVASTRWVVVFEGDEREAEIVNPEQLPSNVTAATRCEFRVMQQSKQTGITARFNRILKGK
jgi:hypothetical protein